MCKIHKVNAVEHDREWLRRQRVSNILLVVLFVFRLVFAHDRQGYAVTRAELWELAGGCGSGPISDAA